MDIHWISIGMHLYFIKISIEFQLDFQWTSIAISLKSKLDVQWIHVVISFILGNFNEILTFHGDFNEISAEFTMDFLSFEFKLDFQWISIWILFKLQLDFQ